MSTLDASIAESLAAAKVGDTVWIYLAERNRYVDGLYDGRGVWEKIIITAETRHSFEVAPFGKFDRKTGRARLQNDYSSGNHIAGHKERDDIVWLEASYKISQRVDRLRDAEKLKQIAAIVGWSPSPPEKVEG